MGTGAVQARTITWPVQLNPWPASHRASKKPGQPLRDGTPPPFYGSWASPAESYGQSALVALEGNLAISQNWPPSFSLHACPTISSYTRWPRSVRSASFSGMPRNTQPRRPELSSSRSSLGPRSSSNRRRRRRHRHAQPPNMQACSPPPRCSQPHAWHMTQRRQAVRHNNNLSFSMST